MERVLDEEVVGEIYWGRRGKAGKEEGGDDVGEEYGRGTKGD